MKIARVLLGIVLLAVMVLPTYSTSAQIQTYSSCFQVQNLESTATSSLVITFYDSLSSATYPYSDPNPLPGNGSRTYCPLPNVVPAGFSGSATIAADKQLAAITNIYSLEGNQYYASYTSFRGGSTSVLLPLLMKNNSGYSTWFHVQNTGSQATNVTVNYSDGTSASYNNLQPGQAYKFDQLTEPHANGWIGSATVTASGGQTIVATVVEVGPTTLFSYDSFTGGSTNPVMPLVNANNSGYITGIQIYNSGSQSTNVTVSYTPSLAGTACTETQTIPAGQSATFAYYAFMAGGSCGAQTFIGSGKVTANSANQPLTAIVNQLNTGAQKGAAYNGFDPASATSTVLMPLIMDRNSGYYTGFSVTNVGTQATNVTCTFQNSSRVVSATLQPGQALTDIQLNQLGDGYIGSATCTASGGDQKIVAIVNELKNTPVGDTFLVYEGTNN